MLLGLRAPLGLGIPFGGLLGLGIPFGAGGVGALDIQVSSSSWARATRQRVPATRPLLGVSRN